MPPRRSAHMAAVAERASSTLSSLPLPPALVLHIFSLLPADERARAACVCRGWRVTLEEPSLWTRLDLSPSSCVAVRVTDAVLAGAVGKARGQLAALDVSGCARVCVDALLAVLRANGGALRELLVGAQDYGMPQSLDADRVERLLQAAPQLTACHAVVLGTTAAARACRMLRNEPPFQALRLCSLGVNFGAPADDEASLLSLAADMAAHASLQRVEVGNAPLAALAALNALVDAALARKLVSLHFWGCRLSPASAPALARLLGGGTLTELIISQADQQMLDVPSAALLGAALRANSTLTKLCLFNVGLWRDLDAAVALLGALTGHPSLRTLKLSNNIVWRGASAAGAALGALVAANAPALDCLSVPWSHLNDAALRPLFEALPRNTHLRTLDVSYNNLSAAFAADVLLPAVRTNTSLRALDAVPARLPRAPRSRGARRCARRCRLHGAVTAALQAGLRVVNAPRAGPLHGTHGSCTRRSHAGLLSAAAARTAQRHVRAKQQRGARGRGSGRDETATAGTSFMVCSRARVARLLVRRCNTSCTGGTHTHVYDVCAAAVVVRTPFSFSSYCPTPRFRPDPLCCRRHRHVLPTHPCGAARVPPPTHTHPARSAAALRGWMEAPVRAPIWLPVLPW
jgi:hypothetical protein